MTCDVLGRTLDAALSSLPENAPRPKITVTTAPVRSGQPRQDGALRVIGVRENEWIVARFINTLGHGTPQKPSP